MIIEDVLPFEMLNFMAELKIDGGVWTSLVQNARVKGVINFSGFRETFGFAPGVNVSSWGSWPFGPRRKNKEQKCY